MIWQTTRFRIDLTSPKVMGIVNVTPDSFSDGGKFFAPACNMASALAHCEQLVKDGADILDIGGESSRPGALPLPLDEELARVLPVVKHAVTLGVPVSVDTYKPDVMQAVLDLGADIINDIWALRQPGARQVIAQHGRCGVCLMHMHREPQTMQAEPMQGDVTAQVLLFLEQEAASLLALGIDKERIVIDPGIGFGKTADQNFALLARQSELLAAGYPLLAGWSRKSSLAAAIAANALSAAAALISSAAVGTAPSGLALQRNMQDRLAPSIAAAILAVERGARVVRVHDVRDTVQALAIWSAARLR